MKKIFHMICLSTALLTQLAQARPVSLEQGACLQDYLSIFDKPEINVTAVFGYDDFEGGTEDPKSLKLFLATLTGHCKKWDDRMCEFSLISNNPYVLRRQIFGPDGRMKILTVTTDSSSVSENDADNRKNPLQSAKSSATKKLFLEGLKGSEVIVYMGHSRDGGGPSFNPPVLTSTGHVDYDWYHKHRDDRRDMNNALRESADKTKIVALLACSTIHWFESGVQQSSPKSGFIGTNDMYYGGHFQHGAVVLEKIFSYECLNTLKLEDLQKVGKVTRSKEWSIPVENANLTQKQVKVQAVDNLAKLLSSPDTQVRKKAYTEIVLFNPTFYSEEAWKRFNTYKFSRYVWDQIRR